MAVDDTLARLPGAFSCNLETCQPLTGLAGLLASQMSFFSVSQMPFLQGADGPALHIQGRTGNQSGD